MDRVLGQGGMGVVVAATHMDLHEERAIKLMRASHLANPKAVERFFREARALVKLRSQHVAEVYDVGRLDCGTPYLVMEKLSGEDLAKTLERRGTLPIAEASRIVLQAAKALADAHTLGIVHRDLKPANLFVARGADGHSIVKVLDFGISKHTLNINDDVEMTGASEVLGSPLYMAPEQMCSAQSVDGRADIWSLGAILHQLLTGRSPFQGTSRPELFAAVLTPVPVRAPSSQRPEIPPALDAIVLRCLEKERIHRYARIDDLIADLSAFLASTDNTEHARVSLVDSLFSVSLVPMEPNVEEPAPQPPKLSRVVLSLSATLLALSLVAFFLSLTSPWEPRIDVIATSARSHAPQKATSEATGATAEETASKENPARIPGTKTYIPAWESSRKSTMASAPNLAGQTPRPRSGNEGSR